MTEPNVASSDATNIGISIVRDEKSQEYVINGRKWWSSGACDRRCKLFVVMGQVSNPAVPPIGAHDKQSMILVEFDH